MCDWKFLLAGLRLLGWSGYCLIWLLFTSMLWTLLIPRYDRESVAGRAGFVAIGVTLFVAASFVIQRFSRDKLCLGIGLAVCFGVSTLGSSLWLAAISTASFILGWFASDRLQPTLRIIHERSSQYLQGTSRPWLASGFRTSVISLLVVLGLIPFIGLRSLTNLVAMAEVGQLAPNLELATYEGKTWRLVEQRGKLVVLEYWGAWCGPCRASIPGIRKLRDKYRDRPNFLLAGVCVGDRDQHHKYCQENQIDWPQLYTPIHNASENRADFPVFSVPSIWIIERDGKVVGANVRTEHVEGVVEAFMKRQEKSQTGN